VEIFRHELPYVYCFLFLQVGLPAKSGVSGCIMLVVPNVMGICMWSPPLNNSRKKKVYFKISSRECASGLFSQNNKQYIYYVYCFLFLQVGLPAKSGVSGCIMLVVPNVMGICMWSPPLDKYGNSVRGIQFCHALLDFYSASSMQQSLQVDMLLHSDTLFSFQANQSLL
jgi:glutaminase